MNKGQVVLLNTGETGYYIEEKGAGISKILIVSNGEPEFAIIPKGQFRPGGSPSAELQKYYGYLDSVTARERR